MHLPVFCERGRTADGPHLDTHPGTLLRSCAGTCVSSKTNYSLDEWHHVVMTFDKGDVKFYLDSSPDGEGTAPSPLSGNSLPLRIGADSNAQNLLLEVSSTKFVFIIGS